MTDFESRSRAALEAGVADLDARVRSRLTQARHAALDELGRRSRFRSRWFMFAPAAALGAAAVVAIAFWPQPQVVAPMAQVAADPASAHALASGDELDFLLGEDLFEAALAAEEPVG